MNIDDQEMISYIKRDRNTFIGLALIALIFTSYDVIEDLQEGLSMDHIGHEILLAALFMLGFLIMLIQKLKRDFRYQNNIEKVESRAETSKNESKMWKQKWSNLSQGLGEMIEEHFTKWGLSNAEKDIGYFLLKGLSTKEIAHLRKTTEKTVRQQCQKIYQKSELQGRTGLSAYFLEDVLQPISAT